MSRRSIFIGSWPFINFTGPADTEYIMWGWFKGKKTDEGSEPIAQEPKDSKEVTDAKLSKNRDGKDKKAGTELLEDRPPKFEDNPMMKRLHEQAEADKQKGVLQRALGTIRAQDFLRIPSIPCMGQAIGTGVAMGGVCFGVLRFMRRSPSALNWGVGSFFLGSVVSWEACRYKIRRAAHVSKQPEVKTIDRS
uniref:Cytochrome c oxidase assembly protein COX20, mitochondrial n=1 Tax=Blastobotrys adeninivorans TaxID=409370 RepID=A0A060TG33_BLAAD